MCKKNLEKRIEVSFKKFLYQTYLNVLKDIDIRIDKLVFATSTMVFFKQELDLFWADNNFEKPRIDLDFERLDSMSYTEITREIYDWYFGEVVLSMKQDFFDSTCMVIKKVGLD